MTEEKKRLYEILFGITLAVFAAALAVADLGGGKYGGDEGLASNEKASALMWYQSKSIKQTLAEGQCETLRSLLEAGAVANPSKAGIERRVQAIQTEIARYKKEKAEIMQGSAGVGKENWVQEVDGKLGQVVGAKEWETLCARLGTLGDKFDLAALFLQMSLVMGAIGIVVENASVKIVFYFGLLSLGLIGSVVTWQAFQLADALPKLL